MAAGLCGTLVRITRRLAVWAAQLGESEQRASWISALTRPLGQALEQCATCTTVRGGSTVHLRGVEDTGRDEALRRGGGETVQVWTQEISSR